MSDGWQAALARWREAGLVDGATAERIRAFESSRGGVLRQGRLALIVFALVSAFRTQEGAEEFVTLAASFGHPATVLPERVRSLGGLYAGLGLEAAPDGSGPLLRPVEESLP